MLSLSTQFLPQETTIAERLKLRRQKTGTGIKILTPHKLLTMLPVLLVQRKAGNNSYTLKKEIRQMVYLLYQHNKINKILYKNLIRLLQEWNQ